MTPVPDYLKQYAINTKQRGNSLSFTLKCSCGCDTFSVMEKDYTDDEKRIISEYEKSIPNIGFHSLYGGVDSDGKPYSYIKILGIFKKPITFPEAPVFMQFDVIKAICPKCQKEIVIFDSRHHGYDGMISDDEEMKKYILHFKQKGTEPCKIEVTVENEPSLEAFQKITNHDCSFEFYSNAFCSISIRRIDINGKKRLLFDFETA